VDRFAATGNSTCCGGNSTSIAAVFRLGIGIAGGFFMQMTRTLVCWGCLALVPFGASACSSEPASGGPSSPGGAPSGEASGGASNDAEGGGVSSVVASATAGGAGSPAAGGSAQIGADASVHAGAGAADTAGAAGAGLAGSADGCDLDAFAREFTTALAKSTAPSGCAIPVEGAPIEKGRPVSSAALEFVANTYAVSPGALTFTLVSCGTPRLASCANMFDKYAGDAGGDLWALAHPFSETIERCSTGVELSAWAVTQDGITISRPYCLMGDAGGQAMGYCVFDADVCAKRR